MMIYFIATLLIIFSMIAYLWLAKKKNIIDKPNHRSSHKEITIRGGGIIIPFAALLYFVFYGFQYPLLVTGLLIISIISFADDIKPLPSRVRIVAHFIAVVLLLVQLDLFDYPWWLILLTIILLTGWINAVNFMDGINGITVVYGLVSVGTFWYINEHIIAFTDTDLLIYCSIALLVFAYFNFRKKARCFAGDIGSIALAFLLGFFLLQLILKTDNPIYLSFFVVYGVDVSITIIERLFKKQNIFTPHRLHLYQLLVNEKKLSHLVVSSIYGSMQLIINAVVIKSWSSLDANILTLLISVFMLTSIVYIAFKIYILKSLKA